MPPYGARGRCFQVICFNIMCLIQFANWSPALFAIMLWAEAPKKWIRVVRGGSTCFQTLKMWWRWDKVVCIDVLFPFPIGWLTNRGLSSETPLTTGFYDDGIPAPGPSIFTKRTLLVIWELFWFAVFLRFPCHSFMSYFWRSLWTESVFCWGPSM